ncbi:MAG: 23S rRNA (adenine(2503)-C(2))-methyltransferase RlmN [Planctomycetes bacterium]|nr:23S rRNA (adenine(2503)-C(2))-methyltransferase RlmN [Planctomycetota bacterium]
MQTDPRSPLPSRPRRSAASPSVPEEAPTAPAGPPRISVFDLSPRDREERLGEWLRQSGEASYRLRQILEWIERRGCESFDAMSDLPRSLRQRLGATFELHPLRLHSRLRSQDATEKFLWILEGGDSIESVLIPDRARITYCISSQAGCAVRCPFCATGQGGFRGQLRASEIIDQVLQMRSSAGSSPTNIVFMGMGEPLLNFEPVCGALEFLADPRGFGFGARRITVSTVGIPDRILELSARFPQVHLALSLHAARDDLRDVLVPLNRRYPLGDVLHALRSVAARTRRLVTFEYVVLPGVNDQRRDIDALVRRLEGIPSRINLIGYNPTPGAPYARPSVRQLVLFRESLKKRFPGPVTLRRSRGEDIDGACGQLRASLGKRSAEARGS